jgi:hypothetical protein
LKFIWGSTEGIGAGIGSAWASILGIGGTTLAVFAGGGVEHDASTRASVSADHFCPSLKKHPHNTKATNP